MGWFTGRIVSQVFTVLGLTSLSICVWQRNGGVVSDWHHQAAARMKPCAACGS